MLLYALCFPHELFLTDQKLQIQILSLLPKLKVPPHACLVTRREAPIPSTQRLPVFLEERGVPSIDRDIPTMLLDRGSIVRVG